ncbi:hypothetical protein KTAU_24990 [Thermogemmatispora aurantia]|uniref:Uncharacterized protein n=1 Tax=Thermogemmatispora aurantia TaxID=2045279 RepID=A0A5J4K9U7_9CHLR|nr:hypothetical protein KTAU_24990 [Thermogemmatispora aurantia]
MTGMGTLFRGVGVEVGGCCTGVVGVALACWRPEPPPPETLIAALQPVRMRQKKTTSQLIGLAMLRAMMLMVSPLQWASDLR